MAVNTGRTVAGGVAIAIGLVLIVISVAGVPALQALQPPYLLQEDFTTNVWSGSYGSTSNVNGWMKGITGSTSDRWNGLRAGEYGSWGASKTIEFTVRVDSWGGPHQYGTGEQNVQLLVYGPRDTANGQYRHTFLIRQGEVRWNVQTDPSIVDTFSFATLAGQEYTWTITIDETGGSVMIYEGTNLIGQTTPRLDTGSNTSPSKAEFAMYAAGGSVSIDYIYIDDGIHPPTGEPPPEEYGYLTVEFRVDGALTNPDGNVIFVEGTGISGTEQWTTSGGSTGSHQVDAGSFSARCTYNGYTVGPSSTTIVAGQSRTISLSYVTNGGGGGDPWQEFLDWLNTTTGKSVLMMSGMSLMGVGAIVIFTGVKSSRSRYY